MWTTLPGLLEILVSWAAAAAATPLGKNTSVIMGCPLNPCGSGQQRASHAKDLVTYGFMLFEDGLGPVERNLTALVKDPMIFTTPGGPTLAGLIPANRFEVVIGY
ncbi:hypothetical protein K445DRAFT_13745 [Daldinia sp. EC12]|nr:hypothetical protein K445DRAFT_13745 [Daldinia sp. EC12]